MRNSKLILVMLAGFFALVSCEKEQLPEAEILEVGNGMYSSEASPSEALKSQAAALEAGTNCFTADFSASPVGELNIQPLFEEGVELLYGASTDALILVEDPETAVTCGASKMLTTVPASASFVLNFEEEVQSVTVTSAALGSVDYQILLTAYSSQNAEGAPLGHSIFNLFGEGCAILTVEATGIRSVELTSTGPLFSGSDPVLNDVHLVSFSFCTAEAGPVDADNDGVDDSVDNCIGTYNPSQEDYDLDGKGDGCDEDIDNDDVLNDDDYNDISSTEPVVVLNGCSTGVDNTVTANGETLADRFAALDPDDFPNYGQYKKAVAQLNELLIEQGIITEDEKDALMGCPGNK